MEDREIIRLYWDRDETAIKATSDKYGHYCRAIARNILLSEKDAEECVNDTYLRAWYSIPPHRPERLGTYLGKITRNLSFNRYKRDNAEKRGGGEMSLILDELADCVSGADDVEKALDRRELSMTVSSFVRGLPERRRRIFVRRYWYAEPVSEIAKNSGMMPGTVSKILERTRKQLRKFLAERGFEI